MIKTSSWFLAGAVLALQVASCAALACSYPKPRPFSGLIESASTIFIFRLESAELKRDEYNDHAYSEWVEGRIRVTQTLKGDASSFRSVTWSTDWCGGVRLDVGHYFLVVTSDSDQTLELAPSDLSIIDITGSYEESKPAASANTGLLRPIFDYLSSGKPLPASFLPVFVPARTSVLPLPPVPNKQRQEIPVPVR